MEISFSKVKDIVKGHGEAQYGQYIDMEMILEDLKEKKGEMDGEEAVLRFLHELSKTG